VGTVNSFLFLTDSGEKIFNKGSNWLKKKSANFEKKKILLEQDWERKVVLKGGKALCD